MITAIAIITLVVGGSVFLYKQQTLDHYDQQMEKYDGFLNLIGLVVLKMQQLRWI